jgi:hypothetical protein
MGKLRDSYANSAKSGFTIDFFSLTAPGSREAFLASPFFSTYEPIRLLSERGCTTKLLVRLCTITTPQVLREALNDGRVSIRYYTAQSFHAKLYIIDDAALVGSANLTDSGLKANREVSVVLTRERDPAFEELPGLFDLFWDYADVLTSGILEQYEKAFRAIDRPDDELEFEKFLETFIPRCAPPTVRVHSDKVTKRRSFLQTFRRKYDETLVPAFREVRDIFQADGRRRSELSGGDLNIELSRFLGWARVVHAPGETWSSAPILNGSLRTSRIQNFINEWHRTSNITNGDMIVAEREIENIDRIRENFSNTENIRQLAYDQIFDTLIGCHAFMELLRFTDGGLPGLRKDFARWNSLQSIQNTLAYLFHGPGASLERAYDCIFDEHYRLGRFGEACVMELSGWMEKDRVPINGRTIKALRFLGFEIFK